jgi:DNA-binding NtrC family response regulator
MKNHRSLHHIVLIDDDQDDCELFGDALNDFAPQIKLSCLNDNERLLHFLVDKHPDIIFLDVNMPKRNGFECLEEIRKVEKFKDTPVVMYSNTGRPEDMKRAYDIGASLFIRKPPTYTGLIDSLRNIVESEWSSLHQNMAS